ncbi:hypothetical protein GCM10023184_45690 [Flaviaesturariibacter amylovorans]|uniref:Uncharacterized protein n=1 Tax=Flaviaesturariibacter amylovorans TaxID=1084520 RepID=A0ABP8HU02_9BACT
MESTLYFPSTFKMAEFIVCQRVRGCESDSRSCTVNGELSEQDIEVARVDYDARIIVSISEEENSAES